MNYFKSLIKHLKSDKKDITPKQITFFLGKALLFFILWKVIYKFFLYDSKILDFPITEHVANSSIFVLNEFTSLSGFTTERIIKSVFSNDNLIYNGSSLIYHYNKLIVTVADECNGLEFLILYIGFIVCMPSKFWRKIKFISIGLIVLHSLNILRAVGLIYLKEYLDTYFDFAHQYLFKYAYYFAIFILWVLFTSKIELKKNTQLT